jgi:hypothetical protein
VPSVSFFLKDILKPVSKIACLLGILFGYGLWHLLLALVLKVMPILETI